MCVGVLARPGADLAQAENSLGAQEKKEFKRARKRNLSAQEKEIVRMGASQNSALEREESSDGRGAKRDIGMGPREMLEWERKKMV